MRLSINHSTELSPTRQTFCLRKFNAAFVINYSTDMQYFWLKSLVILLHTLDYQLAVPKLVSNHYVISGQWWWKENGIKFLQHLLDWQVF